MEDDELFSNFSRQDPEQSNKKDKSFIGKKRKNEGIKTQKSDNKKKPEEKEDSNQGQNLENIINEKKEEENNQIEDITEENIVEIKEADKLKKEKEHLKNQVLKVFPEKDEEIKALKNNPKLTNNDNKNKKLNNNINKDSIQDNKTNKESKLDEPKQKEQSRIDNLKPL